MDYKEFVEKITTGVKERLGMAYQVGFLPIKKNNGISADAICAGGMEEYMRVNVYVEEFYKAYLEHGDMEKCVSEIAATIEQNDIPVEQGEDMRQILSDWDAVKKFVHPALLSADKNQELLQDMPYRLFLDLAIVYIVRFPQEGMCGVIKINRSMIKLWGIGEEELHQTALENQKEECYKIRSLGDIIDDLGISLEEEAEAEGIAKSEDIDLLPMYVLSNKGNFYGAAGVLDDSILAEFAERIQKNLYLLPASIHEFIIVPDEGETNAEELNVMVKEINESVVGTQEVLEDHVYYYDRESRKVETLSRGH